MNVLLVEDEARVADFVKRGLNAEGWSVEHVGDGEAALELLSRHEVDVVLLDLMLPGMSGQDVCRTMRARGNRTPVLMLTALDAVDERVSGLLLGADDYLGKPFDFDELVARVIALVRRSREFGQAPATDRLSHGAVALDVRALRASVEGREIELTARELDLLRLFLGNPGRVFGRERILSAVWGAQEDPLTNVVDVYVGRLRRKLGEHGALIRTVRGHGYRFG